MFVLPFYKIFDFLSSRLENAFLINESHFNIETYLLAAASCWANLAHYLLYNFKFIGEGKIIEQ